MNSINNVATRALNDYLAACSTLRWACEPWLYYMLSFCMLKGPKPCITTEMQGSMPKALLTYSRQCLRAANRLIGPAMNKLHSDKFVQAGCRERNTNARKIKPIKKPTKTTRKYFHHRPIFYHFNHLLKQLCPKSLYVDPYDTILQYQLLLTCYVAPC